MRITKDQKLAWICWHQKLWEGWPKQRREMSPEQRADLQRLASEAISLKLFSNRLSAVDVKHTILELIQDARARKLTPPRVAPNVGSLPTFIRRSRVKTKNVED